jgi:hypothetical protein
MAAAATASGDLPEPVPDGDVELTGFEGPEKTIELDFVIGDGPAAGMRLVTRKQWDSILELASCSIMIEHKDKCIDSYVLSESSLFVMASKLVIKTCGTTTLLLVLPAVVAAAKVSPQRPYRAAPQLCLYVSLLAVAASSAAMPWYSLGVTLCATRRSVSKFSRVQHSQWACYCVCATAWSCLCSLSLWYFGIAGAWARG